MLVTNNYIHITRKIFTTNTTDINLKRWKSNNYKSAADRKFVEAVLTAIIINLLKFYINLDYIR